MYQKFAFTTAAMAAALEDTPVSYEDLADIERQFDDVETEIIRQQVALTQPLYKRRAQTIAQIPNFWPLVLEQAPPDIDQYIQPSDSALLLSSLTSVEVEHFEIGTAGGDPRSVAIRFGFAENEYFSDTTLEKRFWYRHAHDGWAGLVSEPVTIDWKKDRDLTGGLLGMVRAAWEKERESAGETGENTQKGMSEEQKALKKKIENTGMGGLSFFAWFGFIGRRISAEESAEVVSAEKERREKKLPIQVKAQEQDDEDKDTEEEIGMSLEIFLDGDDLAVAITEDLWPGAIKYFTQAQEQDALSDMDFESDNEDLEELGSSDAESEGERPAKKLKPS